MVTQEDRERVLDAMERAKRELHDRASYEYDHTGNRHAHRTLNDRAWRLYYAIKWWREYWNMEARP